MGQISASPRFNLPDLTNTLSVCPTAAGIIFYVPRVVRNSILAVFLVVLNTGPGHTQQELKGEINKEVDRIVGRVVDGFENLESAKYRNTLAVLDFEVVSSEAKEKKIGFGASELIETRLQSTGKFKLVERKQLQKVLNEQDFGMSDLVDEKTASVLGRLIGADIIVIGSVSELGDFFNLNVKLIEVETGTILISEVAEIRKESLISTLGYIEPKNYRIGVGFGFSSLQDKLAYSNAIDAFDNGKVDLTFNIEYSRNITKKLFWDVEAVLSNHQTAGNKDSASLQLSEPRHHLRILDPQLFLTGKINYLLIDFRTIGLSAFTGIGVTGNRYQYHALWERELFDTPGFARKTYRFLPYLPLGASLHLYQISAVSVRIDLGYTVPLKKARFRYPAEISGGPKDLEISSSGFTSSVKLRMYF